MRYILGVDGGGSKTRVVLVSETGQQLGVGVAGGANHQTLGVPQALANLRAATECAVAGTGVATGQVDFVMYGLAGADRPRDFALLHNALSRLPFSRWEVVGDAWAGLRIGSHTGVGVALVCGTAANAVGRNQQGEMAQIGGFGYLYGDAAGGSWLATQALRAAIRAHERREQPTLLTEWVPRRLGYASVEQLRDDLLDRTVDAAPPQLTPLLHDAAAAGDAVARRLLAEMGRELGCAAVSVIHRLGGAGAFGGSTIQGVLIGSVLRRGRSPDLLQALEQTVSAVYPTVAWQIPAVEPVYGAVLLAFDRLGLTVDDAVQQQFS